MGWFHLPYFISHLFLLLLLHFPSHTYTLCNLHDSSALLLFKNSFVINATADDETFTYQYNSDSVSYGYESPCSSFSSKTESWKNGTDCCNWDGVTCDAISGYVIGLDLSCGHLRGEFHPNSTIFQLRHLQQLNLAYNNFSLSPLYSGIGDLFQLTHLNLSSSEIRGDIPSTISHLSKLESLDLSYLRMRLDPSTWNKLILNTTNLRELRLNGIDMSSIRVSSLMNLSSSLVSLHLAPNGLQGNLSSDILSLPNLQELDLSSNDELRGQLPKSNWSSPLWYLDLSWTSFSGDIPNSIGHLKHLNQLHLSYCKFNGSIPLSLWNLTQLTYLDLLSNNLEGEIPSLLSNLKHLTTFVLGQNNFSGYIPEEVFKLIKLENLDLSMNSLTGPIPSKTPTSSKLSYLALDGNMLNGTIPHWCFSLPSLLSLDLSGNQLTWSINVGEFSNSSLEYLYLSNNNLQGMFPYSILEFENLTKLDLSSNHLSGVVDFHQFSKLKRLRLLDLSNASFLSINDSDDNVLPNLDYLNLSSCNINSTFPKFLAKLQNLQLLDLSNNNIHGKIPNLFHEKLLHSWKKIYYIDLSFNKLQGDLPIPLYGTRYFLVSNNNFTGEIYSTICNASSLVTLNLAHNNLIGTIPQCMWKNIQHIDLSYNKLQGDLPILPYGIRNFLGSNNNFTGDVYSTICNASSLNVLDLAHNNLKGTIPRCICNASSLYILNLAHNKLTGTIPKCLETFRELLVLDLRMNNLYGSMPRNFSKRNVFETIKLNGNQLEGPLPQSLAYCKKLEVLDLGDNNIEDSFPSWLETLQELQVLSLRSNKLRGIVTCSTTNHPFPKLRILDVSNNNLSGFLPGSCFTNFQGMMNVDDDQTGSLYMARGDYYNDSVVVTMKGQEMELKRILSAFTTIDLSNNMFGGAIPKVIGRLKSIIGLNLSHNGINGSIPHSLSNLSNLEWLDLSWNQLTGDIPLTLTNLNFLSTLTLQQNHLEGIIPTSGQFNTFGNDSYEGNPLLCGFPLSKSCSEDEEQPPHSTFQNDEESWFGWKSVAVGYACGAVFGILLGYNLFLTGKPQRLAAFVEGLFGIRVKRANSRARANRRGMN